jgi:ribonuclease-3
MDAPPIEELGAKLGVTLTDPELIRQAFVHSSYFNENPDAVAGHNERLEFYGDAVIGIVVSRLLYERYPDEDEGFLTARRAALVNREALAAMARDLGLPRYLQLGRGEAEAGGARRPSLLAASFEALAGALSLSLGQQLAGEAMGRLFQERLDALPDAGVPPKSAKSRLQEWTQRHRATKPVYRLISTSGPPHAQRFRVSVVIEGRVVAQGSGSSRQRAEEQAAAAALASLEEEATPPAVRAGGGRG